MRIDVLVPTRDRPHALARALTSLQRQRHGAWRAWVVDDGDGRGVRTVARMADARIVAFRNPGTGQVDARNAALAAASGEVCMLLDDDDQLVDPGHMQEIVRLQRAGPVLVHRRGWLVFERDGVEIHREPFAPVTRDEDLRRDNTVLTCGLAWPRALHERLGTFDRAADGYFDWDWILRVQAAGVPRVEIAAPGVAYTIHAGNGSGRRDARRALAFAHLRAKHHLRTDMKDHLTVHRERLGRAAGGPRVGDPHARPATARSG
jgi:glycosyltransferase involved in cell wall biosynthesis